MHTHSRFRPSSNIVSLQDHRNLFFLFYGFLPLTTSFPSGLQVLVLLFISKAWSLLILQLASPLFVYHYSSQGMFTKVNKGLGAPWDWGVQSLLITQKKGPQCVFLKFINGVRFLQCCVLLHHSILEIEIALLCHIFIYHVKYASQFLESPSYVSWDKFSL